jgi:long-subunit fatty acid transport protein
MVKHKLSYKALLGVAGALALTSGVSSVARADGVQDFYVQLAHQRFYANPQSARSWGMGGSINSVSHDSSNVLQNPAGLGWMEDAEVSAAYGYETITGNDRDTFADIEQEFDSGYAVGAFPIVPTLDGLPEYGTFGLGWSGFDSDVDDSLNTETDGYRLHFAYGVAVNPYWSVGYSLSYNDQTQENDVSRIEGDDGYRHTMGVQYKHSDVWTFGSSLFIAQGDPTVSVGNLSSDIDQDSIGFDVGAAYLYQQGTLVGMQIDYVSYDAEGDIGGVSLNEDGDAMGVRLGVEQDLNEWSKGRLGYRYQSNFEYDFDRDEAASGTAKFNAISFGAGVFWDHLRLDYGAEYRWIADGDWSHWVTASVPFSLCVEDYE